MPNGARLACGSSGTAVEKQHQPANEKAASDANFLMGTFAVVKTLMVRMDFEMSLLCGAVVYKGEMTRTEELTVKMRLELTRPR